MHPWILLAVFLAQTAAPPATPSTDAATPAAWAPPATQPGEDGWLVYEDAPTWTAETVGDLRPGNATPEAAVVHYLASRVRGDEAYRETLLLASVGDDRMARKLAEHDRWTFHAFRLVSRKERESGELWIKVWMRISFENDMDSGQDEFTVSCSRGACVLLNVPT